MYFAALNALAVMAHLACAPTKVTQNVQNVIPPHTRIDLVQDTLVHLVYDVEWSITHL